MSNEDYLRRKMENGSLDKYLSMDEESLKELHEAFSMSDKLEILQNMGKTRGEGPFIEMIIDGGISGDYKSIAVEWVKKIMRDNPIRGEGKSREDLIEPRRRRLEGKASVEYNFLPRSGKKAAYTAEEKKFVVRAYSKGLRGDKLKDAYNDAFPDRARNNAGKSFNRRAQQFKKAEVK